MRLREVRDQNHDDGWTLATLREYLLALRAADGKAVDAALAASQKAVDTAMASQEKATGVQEITAQRWREQANEWRGAMDDRDRKAAEALQRYAQRAEVDLMLSAVDEKIRLIRDEMKAIQAALAATAGRSAGVSAAWGWLVGAIGIAGAIVAIIIGTR
jgi:hypothetical protein